MTDEPTSTPTPASEPTPVETPAAPASAAVPPPAPAPAPVQTLSKKSSSVINPYTWGTGRRKSAVARVRIRPGDGKFIINKRDMDKYFLLDKDRKAVLAALEVTETQKTMDVFVNVYGGGVTGQAGAVVLGLARALLKTDAEHQPKLREHNLLRRDPRRVERKKYGQRGARRRFQFSKR